MYTMESLRSLHINYKYRNDVTKFTLLRNTFAFLFIRLTSKYFLMRGSTKAVYRRHLTTTKFHYSHFLTLTFRAVNVSGLNRNCLCYSVFNKDMITIKYLIPACQISSVCA